MEKAREDHLMAVKQAANPDDPLLISNERKLQRMGRKLEICAKRYEKQQRRLYKEKIMGKLERRNVELREKEKAREEERGRRKEAEEEEELPELEE